MMDREGARLAKTVKGKLNEPLSSVGPETGPANIGKKETGTLVSDNEKMPCPKLNPNNKEGNCLGPVKKLGSKPCPGPVTQVMEEHEAKKEQCSSRLLKEAVQTTVIKSGPHKDSSRQICFPNRHIRHIYHPGLSKEYNICLDILLASKVWALFYLGQRLLDPYFSSALMAITYS